MVTVKLYSVGESGVQAETPDTVKVNSPPLFPEPVPMTLPSSPRTVTSTLWVPLLDEWTFAVTEPSAAALMSSCVMLSVGTLSIHTVCQMPLQGR